MKSKTLTLKTTTKELDFLKKANIIQWNTGKERFTVARKQINRKKILDPRNAKELRFLSVSVRRINSIKLGIISNFIQT